MATKEIVRATTLPENPLGLAYDPVTKTFTAWIGGLCIAEWDIDASAKILGRTPIST